jgi:hypothetical protein
VLTLSYCGVEKRTGDVMRTAATPIIFPADSGIGLSIVYIVGDVELTDKHIKLILEARELQASGKYNEPKLKWFKPEYPW